MERQGEQGVEQEGVLCPSLRGARQSAIVAIHTAHGLPRSLAIGPYPFHRFHLHCPANLPATSRHRGCRLPFNAWIFFTESLHEMTQDVLVENKGRE
jgi:hypothetical protein